MVVCLGGPTCRGCGVGFICGGGGLAYTTEAGCPGGNEGCECGRKGRIGSCIDKCLDDACRGQNSKQINLLYKLFN